MIKAIIIDDEVINIELLTSLLEKYCPDIKLMGSAETLESSLELVAKTKPNLIFLDVEIQDKNGFDIIKLINNPNIAIITITAHERYAIQAIKSSTFDYILKPIQIEELVKAVNKYKEFYNRQNLRESEAGYHAKPQFLTIPSREHVDLIQVNDIVYLKAANSCTKIETLQNKKYTSTRSMKENEVYLPNHSFIRVHNSYIVNLQHVIKFCRARKGMLIMSNGSEVPVSASKRKEIFDLLNV